MKSVKSIKSLQPPTGVLGGALSADGQTAFAACFNGDVLRYDLEKEGEPQRIGSHQSYATGAAIRTESNQLITSGYDGRLIWFDLESGKEIRRVKAHAFWSWDMKLSQDEKWVASVSGQYLAGGYKYEPAESTDPTVKVFDAETGELAWAFALRPSVQAVAISPDNKLVAAGNLMGDVSVWSLETGKSIGHSATDEFTSWGIIKSHCYIGGVFALHFAHDSRSLYAAGMGPMRDPMAGNGKQRWHRYEIPTAEPESPGELKRVAKSKDSECGEGLIESSAIHPSGSHFVIAGRLRGGQWNAAFFEHESGKRVHHLNTKFRITTANYDGQGNRLLLGGAVRQPKPNKEKTGYFGRLALYEIE